MSLFRFVLLIFKQIFTLLKLIQKKTTKIQKKINKKIKVIHIYSKKYYKFKISIKKIIKLPRMLPLRDSLNIVNFWLCDL